MAALVGVIGVINAQAAAVVDRGRVRGEAIKVRRGRWAELAELRQVGPLGPTSPSSLTLTSMRRRISVDACVIETASSPRSAPRSGEPGGNRARPGG